MPQFSNNAATCAFVFLFLFGGSSCLQGQDIGNIEQGLKKFDPYDPNASGSLQTTSAPGDNIIGPSPNAASLGKYVSVPVGLSTGVPQINIALWELKEGDLSVPISLSYHAAGNKVDELAPWTGLGWTLNAGGVISRAIMGSPDDSRYGTTGFLYHNLKPNALFDGTPDQDQQYYLAAGMDGGCVDVEPDQYTFNFAGYTGKFTYTWDRKLVISSESKIEIKPFFIEGEIAAWNVTTEDGIIYVFGATETTDNLQRVDGVHCKPDYSPVTSWYLTQIVSPEGHQILFKYAPYDLQYRYVAAMSTNYKWGFDNWEIPAKTHYQTVKINGLHLKSITTSSGNTSVEFVQNSSSPRTDIPNLCDYNMDAVLYPIFENKLYSLDEIIVRNKDEKEIKHIKNEYDYSTGRLTLKNIREFPRDNSSESKPPHSFAYHSQKLPEFTKNSYRIGFFQQDHEGYLNANTKNTLIPRGVEIEGSYYNSPGADRSPNEQLMQAGILTEIKYPTGATTRFEYEPHDYRFIGGNSVLTFNKMAGGLRVKKIIDSDGPNDINKIVRKYNYTISHQGAEVSSGVISAEPVYQYWILLKQSNLSDNYSHFTGWTFDWQEVPNSDKYELVNMEYGENLTESTTSNSYVPALAKVSVSKVYIPTINGSRVGYRKVTVSNGENGEFGKTESLFSSFYDANDQYYPFEIPFRPPVSNDYQRGLLTREIDYEYDNGTYKQKRQIENKYQFAARATGGFKTGASCGNCSLGEEIIYIQPYYAKIGISKLESSVETLFENNQSFTTQHSYTYDPELQFLLKETTGTSEGKQLVTEYCYPLQYTTNPSPIIASMQQQHILSPVIEQTTREKSSDGTEVVIGSSFTQFELFNSKIMPAKEFRFTTDKPAVDFQSSVILGSPDMRYYTEVSAYNRYSGKAKPEQITTSGDVVSSYIWGHDGSLPVAKITNAPFDRCAFSSFETENGNWNLNVFNVTSNRGAKSGKYAYLGIINSQPLINGEYIVSLWAKGSGSITVNGVSKTIDADWKHYEWRLSSPGTASIDTNGNVIDDLRLHPAGAQMVTYTYEPQIGISSITDQNNISVYYEYDSFGRLKIVRDNEGNILKTYLYQYR